jgi:hypothetical protein
MVGNMMFCSMLQVLVLSKENARARDVVAKTVTGFNLFRILERFILFCLNSELCDHHLGGYHLPWLLFLSRKSEL